MRALIFCALLFAGQAQAINPYADVGKMTCRAFGATYLANTQSPYRSLVLSWLAIEFINARADKAEYLLALSPDDTLLGIATACGGFADQTLEQRLPLIIQRLQAADLSKILPPTP